MDKIAETFKLKTLLLCKGLSLEPKKIKYYQDQGMDLLSRRKGGAGPLGGRYFLFEDGKTIVNCALWENNEKNDLTLGEKSGDYFQIHNNSHNDAIGRIKLVENPAYYSSEFKTSDGVEMRKIALVHGVDCLATTIYQKCKYWECGQACQFCGIELSYHSQSTILEKTPQQISEVVFQAKKEHRCSHMTLTSGTEDSEDKGAERYIRVVSELKTTHPNLPLHIQIEPLSDLNYLRRLKEVGADTAGIHIEIFDDIIRSIITPGKFNIPYSEFKTNWKEAVEIFGENQVETFVLTGFGENISELLDSIEEIVRIGVIPFVTPVRSLPGQKKSLPSTNPDILLEIYAKTAQIMRDYGVNPLKNKAGCVRCGGCSSLNEAYLAI